MSKQARTILFYLLVVIFIIVTPMVLLYSEGYRFDFETNKIIETGGFYIKTNPEEVTISINNKIKKTTSNFSRNVLIQDLTPKTYNIKISKTGYFTWEKNLEIIEKKVSELDITLFKESYEKKLINENLLGVYEIEDGFIVEKETGYYYYNPENNKEELITKDIDWDNVQIVKNDLLAQKDDTYSLISLTDSNEFKESNQKSFKKDNLDNLYYLIRNNLYKNQKIIKTEVDLYELNNNTVYYFRDGFLYRDNAKLIANEFTFEENKTYELIFLNDLIFLNENKEKLYLLENEEFKKIITLNHYFEYSEWDGKILINTGNEIWVYFSKETYYPEFVEKNNLKLIARFQDKVQDLHFINDKYYIFAKDDKLIVSELDYRDKINIFTIASNSENSNIFFNCDNKTIYIFENNKLYSISKILP